MKLWQTVAALVVVAGGSLAMGDTYGVDPVHSSAIFRIKHQGASFVYGRITGPEGTVSYDAAKPEATSFDISVKTANVDTANANRDNHLKSPSFFNAKEFPTLTFKSTSVKKVDDTNLEVTGDLTIHGVTKSVTVKVEKTGEAKDMKGTPVIGFETTFDIKRSDFGMKEMVGPVADDVRLIVALEADKK